MEPEEATLLVQGVLVTGKFAFPTDALSERYARRMERILMDAVACMGLEGHDLCVLFDARIWTTPPTSVDHLVVRRDAVGATVGGRVIIGGAAQMN